jgi:uncharacterized membrane protein YkvA (DUF1232 family)
MAYKLTIELSERDLKHFRRELRRARESVGIADDEEILGAAAELVASLRRTELPDFVTARLEKLELMLAMMRDDDWELDEQERNPVLSALAYLCDPEDVIPDNIPGIGLLDDAVMIELAFRELRHEIDAYEDFCRYRKSLSPRKAMTKGNAATLAAKLGRRRTQLVARMRRRRNDERRRGKS